MTEIGQLVQDVLTKEGRQRERAVKALGASQDPKAAELLIALLSDRHESVRIRRFAAAALKEQKDPRAVDSLISALNDDDPHLRFHAMNALLAVGAPAVRSLMSALESAAPLTRRKAAEALGIIKDIQAVPPLIQTARDEDREVRKEAVRALRNMKDRRAVESLNWALRDEDWNVREIAAEALGEIGDPRAATYLLAALEGEDQCTDRSAAAKALGKIKDSRAVAPLIATLEAKDQRIDRSIVAEALGEIGDPRAIAALIAALEEDRVRIHAAHALAKIGAPAIGHLIKALKGESWSARASAVDALVDIGASAVKPLVDSLTDWHCGERVAEALCRLRWKPQSVEERVHVLVAERGRGASESKLDWATIRDVLLNDVEPKHETSGKSWLLALMASARAEEDNDESRYRVVENALFAFMALGKEEIIPVLVEKLNAKGNKTMAEAFLNCGHPELTRAAKKWGERRGYIVKAGQGAHPVSWGTWR